MFDLTFTRRDLWISLGIVLLAFAFRMVIIVDRATVTGYTGQFDPLPSGTDQGKYYGDIAAYRAGDFPPARYFFQPGMSWFLIGASEIVRTDNLAVLRIFVAFLASWNCALFVVVTRLAFGRRDVAYGAGLLLAIYPVGAFYDTDFVITSQTTELLTLALFGILWLWRSPRNSTGAVLYGASFGLLAITRFEPVFLAPVFGLWLIAFRRDWQAVGQVALAAVICVGLIVPVALHNRAGGANYLITPVGSAEIYRGHNRDADGAYGGGIASGTTHNEYRHYLWNDIKLSPQRFVELEMHKIGMYFSPDEPGNNLNYVLSGEAVSPLLRAIPLDFRILLVLFLFGLVVLARRREPAAWLFGAGFAVLMAAILMIWVEARLRTPAVTLMIPPAVYGVVAVIDWLRQDGRRSFGRTQLTRYVTLALVVALALVASNWAYHHLPRKVTVDRLPATAQPIDAVFDDTLRLVGWDVRDEYTPAGIIEPHRPYVIALYWELLQPTTTDYSFSLGYFVDGERLIAFDRPIGWINYPPKLTSDWQPGTVYVDFVGIEYRNERGPLMISSPLLLSVYRDRFAEYLVPAAGDLPDPTHIELARPAIMWGPGSLPETAVMQDAEIPFGDVLVLKGWDFPASGAAGDSIDVTLGWQRTGAPITRNLIFSAGLLDESDQVATNADSPPHGGRLLAPSLPALFSFGDTKSLVLPAEPGTYTLYVLVYDFDSRQRLTVPGAPGDLLRLGTVAVE